MNLISLSIHNNGSPDWFSNNLGIKASFENVRVLGGWGTFDAPWEDREYEKTEFDWHNNGSDPRWVANKGIMECETASGELQSLYEQFLNHGLNCLLETDDGAGNTRLKFSSEGAEKIETSTHWICFNKMKGYCGTRIFILKYPNHKTPKTLKQVIFDSFQCY